MFNLKSVLAVLFFLTVSWSSAAFAMIINDPAALKVFVDTQIGANVLPFPGSSTLVNGKSVMWFLSSSTPGAIDVEVNGVAVASGDLAAAYVGLARAFGISITAVSVSNPNSPSVATTNLLFSNLVVPVAKTAKEKSRNIRQSNILRTFGASLSSEFVSRDNDYNGQIYGMSLGLAYDFDNFTVGVMLPYQHFDYNILYGDRIGTVFFGQYNIPVGKELNFSLTGNLNWLNNNVDYKLGGNQNDNTLGGGISTGVQYALEKIELGAGFTYQFNQDDSRQTDNSQHLLKMGTSAGLRIGNDQVASINFAYTNDPTTYKVKPNDQDYYEVGGDYRNNLSDTWGLNIGYKKTIGLRNYKSDLVYFGSAVHF